MLDQIPELPALLLLYEEGYCQQHQPGMSTTNADPENEQWIQTGWHIRSHSGQTFFRHRNQTVIENWFAEHGYVDIGDGAHYQRKAKKQKKSKEPQGKAKKQRKSKESGKISQ